MKIISKLGKAISRAWQILTCDHEWEDESAQEAHCKKCPAFRSVHGI